MKKQYYAVTATMIFEKTVLVPVDAVADIYEAMEIVDNGVEDTSIELLSGDADYKVNPSTRANGSGICELTEDESKKYQIVRIEEA